MKQPGNFGWKFNHPDLEQTIGSKGDQAPAGLVLDSRTGIDMVSEDEAVRQAVYMLLSTRPGERLMRPEYGCNLQQLVFSPNDDTTAGIAIYMVRTALKQWEPRIEIHALDAYPDPHNPTVLVISLLYQVRMTRTVDEVQLYLNMAGEEN
jgi:phage baseplate assembly protein W